MASVAFLDAARMASLATGRGGLPEAGEWPWVAALLLLLGFVGTRLLMTVGLTRVEAITIAGISPALVLVDAPLGTITPGMALAANVTGCLLPVAVSVKVLLERRAAALEFTLLAAVAIAVSFASSHVEPGRGVLLQYRVPALATGLLAAVLFRASPERAGAAAFAAGTLGVLVGADLLRLQELAAAGGAGRVILGGAGLMDGILLVALLSGAVAACGAACMKLLFAGKAKQRSAA